jgi:hypothetical protein
MIITMILLHSAIYAFTMILDGVILNHDNKRSTGKSSEKEGNFFRFWEVQSWPLFKLQKIFCY